MINRLLVLGIIFLFFSCSSVKVLNTWKGDQDNVEKFKTKNVLVLARTANDHERIAFEEAVANQLREQGIKVTESFKKAPKIAPEKEVTQERLDLIKSLLASEGFNAIVVISIKDKEQITRHNNSGIYMGATYGNYYPGTYSSFYNYFAAPYFGGPYYGVSYGEFIPTSRNTTTETNYVLETAAYNLDEPKEGQLVTIQTTQITNPKEAYKTADKYIEKSTTAFKKTI